LTTYEIEINKPIERTAENLQPTKDNFTLGAFDGDGALVAIVTFVRERNLKMIHKGNAYTMYVEPEKRGQGTGKVLLLHEL
jgi:GNAT superfamily N-acetyltransferase